MCTAVAFERLRTPPCLHLITCLQPARLLPARLPVGPPARLQAKNNNVAGIRALVEAGVPVEFCNTVRRGLKVRSNVRQCTAEQSGMQQWQCRQSGMQQWQCRQSGMQQQQQQDDVS